MAKAYYVPPHKRSSNALTPTPTLPPPSISGPPGHNQRCVARWSPLPPFPDDHEHEDDPSLEPFCDPIRRRTGYEHLVSSSAKEFPWSAEAAASAIAGRFLPDLLDAAKKAKEKDVAKDEEKEEVKMSVAARMGKVLFQSGDAVSMNSLREAVKAGEEGSSSQLRKIFYTDLPSECLDNMERSAVEKMGLEFHSSKERYHVKVSDNHRSDSAISCICTVQDGTLAIHKVELNQVRRHLVEDISCLSKDLDLRLVLSTKTILKNLDAEVENALNCLVRSAVIDPNVKGGLTWPSGNDQWDNGRFSVVEFGHTNYKVFRNENLRLRLRHADRFDHENSTGEVSDEVNFKLIGISKRLETGDHEENSLKEMLESAIRMIWESALNYKMAY